MDSTTRTQDEITARRAALRVMDAADLLREGRDDEARAVAQEAVNALNAVFWPDLLDVAGSDIPGP